LSSPSSQTSQRSYPLYRPEQEGRLDRSSRPKSPHEKQTQDAENDGDHDDAAGPQEMRAQNDETEHHGEKLKPDQP
jgi:hypothetical protein